MPDTLEKANSTTSSLQIDVGTFLWVLEQFLRILVRAFWSVNIVSLPGTALTPLEPDMNATRM